MDEDSDVEEQDLMDHTGSRFVMKEGNKFRKASMLMWDICWWCLGGWGLRKLDVALGFDIGRCWGMRGIWGYTSVYRVESKGFAKRISLLK